MINGHLGVEVIVSTCIVMAFRHYHINLNYLFFIYLRIYPFEIVKIIMQ